MGKLDGKVGLVTGSARGLGRACAQSFGRACAQSFGREGAKVVVADLQREGGEETVRLIKPSAASYVHGHTLLADGGAVLG